MAAPAAPGIPLEATPRSPITRTLIGATLGAIGLQAFILAPYLVTTGATSTAILLTALVLALGITTLLAARADGRNPIPAILPPEAVAYRAKATATTDPEPHVGSTGALDADDVTRFLDRAAHELRTPLTSIVLDVESLGRTDGQATGATVERLRRNAERMQHLLAAMTEHGQRRPPTSVLEDRTIDLMPTIVTRLGNEPIGRHVTVEENDAAPAHMAPDELAAIIAELARNAQRFAPHAQHEIMIGPGTRLTWHQTPAGLEPEAAKHLGEPFATYHATSRGGLGLHHLRTRLEGMGGHFRARLVDGALAFELKLPEAQPDAQVDRHAATKDAFEHEHIGRAAPTIHDDPSAIVIGTDPDRAHDHDDATTAGAATTPPRT